MMRIPEIQLTWLKWSINNLRKDRKKIIHANENEKQEICKHLVLNNLFLLRRTKDVIFSNYIYFQIISNQNTKKQIFPQVFEHLAANIIYKSELESLTKDRELYSPDLNKAAINYMSNQMQKALKGGDFDEITVLNSFLQEYDTGVFNTGEIFKDIGLYNNLQQPDFYRYFSNKYATSTVNNQCIYQLSGASSNFFMLSFSRIFADDIRERMEKMTFEVLDVERDIDMVLGTSTFFNHLLSIASALFFNNLYLKKKIKLLNRSFKFDDFVSMIKNSKLNWKFRDWYYVISTLNRQKYAEYALRLCELIEREFLTTLKKEYKYYYHDSYATACRNLRDYKNALKHYRLSFKHVGNSRFQSNQNSKDGKSQSILAPHFGSLPYRKAVCLKNIAECNYHLGFKDEAKKKFILTEKFIPKLTNEFEKYSLYFNLAMAYRKLQLFQKEKLYLNKAIKLNSNKTPMSILNFVDRRISDFLNTKMIPQKLKRLSKLNYLNEQYGLGLKLQRSFLLHDSLQFFQKALDICEEENFGKEKGLILQSTALSHLYLKNWKQAVDLFRRASAIKDRISIDLYFFIALYMNGEREEAIKIAIKITEVFSINQESFLSKSKLWSIDLLNYLGEERILDFCDQFVKSTDLDAKWNLIYQIGLCVADEGFPELAIALFKMELPITKDNHIKMLYLNDIGSAYYDMGKYDIAIEHLNKAIEFDSSFPNVYWNLANAYGKKLNFIEAQKNIDKAIKLAQEKDSPKLENFKEEKKFIDSMVSEVINLNKITSPEVISILTSAEQFYFDYKDRKHPEDLSAIVLGHSKGLERILHEYVSPIFTDLIDKYRNKKLPFDVIKKFGALFKNQSITTGTWSRIFKDLQKLIKDQILKEFKEVLYNELSEEARRIIGEACDFIAPERNPLTHTELISLEEVIEVRKEAILKLNKVIQILF